MAAVEMEFTELPAVVELQTHTCIETDKPCFLDLLHLKRWRGVESTRPQKRQNFPASHACERLCGTLRFGLIAIFRSPKELQSLTIRERPSSYKMWLQVLVDTRAGASLPPSFQSTMRSAENRALPKLCDD